MAEISSNEPFPIPTQTDRPQPKEAYMLEVTVDKSVSGVTFKYTQYWHEKFPGNGDKHQLFLDWVADLIKNPSAGKAFAPFDHTPGKRKPTKMSFKCKDLVYVVLKLDPALNWRFAADSAPISMDKVWNGKGVFFNATNLDENGVETVPGQINDHKYAYVIADCPKGKPQAGDAIEARFNLHVDFVEGSNNDDPYVPVIIDPDVRNPGGNGP